MFQICDSLFPIGSFTLSNGLETFTQELKLASADDLKKYVKNYLTFLPYNELGFLFLLNSEPITESRIIEFDQVYAALRSAREVREGSEKLCRRFLKVWQKIEALPSLVLYESLIKRGICDGHHAIAVALFMADKGVDLKQGAAIYAYSLVSAIITNAVKLVPLSQLDGQAILNASLSEIDAVVAKAQVVKFEELGLSGAGFELAAFGHETLYSRLYMS